MFLNTRFTALIAIFALYCVPLLAYGFYIAQLAPAFSWQAFTIALLMLSIGTLLFFLLIYSREAQQQVDKLDKETFVEDAVEATISKQETEQYEEKVKHVQVECMALSEENERLQEQLHDGMGELISAQSEREMLRGRLADLNSEFAQFKELAEEKFEQNQIFLHEHQQTITEQRYVIEIKQQYIQQLEDKVRDLTYEIKTLLHLAEKTQIGQDKNFIPRKEVVANIHPGEGIAMLPHAEKLVSNEGEAVNQLRRCIDIAQKMTGASHYSRLSKRPEQTIEHYALDLRCLFESLRSENSSAIFLYSPKDNKLIFSNDQIKPLLGWNSEKFMQSFSSIVDDHSDAWNGSLAQLAYKNECQVELSLKSKSGASVPLQCHLGVIPTGIFRSNIFGLLYKQ